MDFGTFSGLYTAFLLVLFVGIIYWAYHKKSKARFDEAANSIFEEDDKPNKDSSGAHKQ